MILIPEGVCIKELEFRMRFTVIIPIYNMERYLEQCLESVVGQTFQDYEVILVDDGSVDGSAAICDRYSALYPYIHTIHQTNQGLSGARNTGLDAASGEWIVFVDSDDWIEKGMLELLNQEIRRCPADLYAFNAWFSDEDGNDIGKMILFPEHDVVFFHDEKERFLYYRDRLTRYQHGWEAWNRVFKRELIERHGLRFVPTAEIFAEDYLFTFQYLLYVKKIRLLCHIWYHYRQREGSLLHSKNQETLIPRLFRLGDEAWEEIIHAGKRDMAEHFDILFTAWMKHHLWHVIHLPVPQIEKQLAEEVNRNRIRKLWFRRKYSWLHDKIK